MPRDPATGAYIITSDISDGGYSSDEASDNEYPEPSRAITEGGIVRALQVKAYVRSVFDEIGRYIIKTDLRSWNPDDITASLSRTTSQRLVNPNSNWSGVLRSQWDEKTPEEQETMAKTALEDLTAGTELRFDTMGRDDMSRWTGIFDKGVEEVRKCVKSHYDFAIPREITRLGLTIPVTVGEVDLTDLNTDINTLNLIMDDSSSDMGSSAHGNRYDGQDSEAELDGFID